MTWGKRLKTRWRMILRMWLFAAAAVAAMALFHPRPEAAREWMHAQGAYDYFGSVPGRATN